MFSIAQAKARACKNGKTLQNPGVLNMITLYVIPWMSGTNYFVVNAAPGAKVDSEIAEVCKSACALIQEDDNIWHLP